jgi:hypothetical protein
MKYQKILRWIGGSGGDALMQAILLSHPEFICNSLYFNKILSNGGVYTEKNKDFDEKYSYLKYIGDTKFDESEEGITSDFHRLLKESKFILKSHCFNLFDEHSIDILPTENTAMFTTSAFFNKRNYTMHLRNKEDFDEVRKDKKKFIKKLKEQHAKKIKNLIINNKNKDFITVEQLLLCKFDIIEEKLNLKINSLSTEFLKNWADMQFIIYKDCLTL